MIQINNTFDHEAFVFIYMVCISNIQQTKEDQCSKRLLHSQVIVSV